MAAGAEQFQVMVTSTAEAMRFSVQSEAVSQLRVELFDLAGRRVFDSGFVGGSALEWRLSDSYGQPVSNGIYLYAVTAKDINVRPLKRKLGKVAVLRGSPKSTSGNVADLRGSPRSNADSPYRVGALDTIIRAAPNQPLDCPITMFKFTHIATSNSALYFELTIDMPEWIDGELVDDESSTPKVRIDPGLGRAIKSFMPIADTARTQDGVTTGLKTALGVVGYLIGQPIGVAISAVELVAKLLGFESALKSDVTTIIGPGEQGSYFVQIVRSDERFQSNDSWEAYFYFSYVFWSGSLDNPERHEVMKSYHCTFQSDTLINPLPASPTPPTDTPDLTITHLALDGYEINSGGDGLFIRTTVENVGAADSPESRLALYVSDDATITPDDQLIATRSVPSLKAGARWNSCSESAWKSCWKININVPKGKYYAGLIINPDKAFPESNDTNNSIKAPTQLQAF